MAWLCWSPSGLCAEHADGIITEQQLLSEVPLVITASRLLQAPPEAPASVTVIDRAMIEAATAIEIQDLLRLVPGFQVTYANGNLPSVTYHGHEDEWSNRMQVLVDGRSVYVPLFSIIDWNHLNITLEDIERIEVIRGPDAPVYGSNAFLSTINIITRQPFQDQGVTGKITAGSLSTRNALLRYAGMQGNLDYRISVSHRADEGFENVNDRKRLDSVSLRGVYDATPSDSLDVQLGYTAGPMGAWGQSPVTSPDRDKDTKSYFGYTRWRHAWGTRSDLHLQAYYNYLEWRDHYQIGPLSALFGVPPAMIPLLFAGEPDQTIDFSRYDGITTRTDIELQHTLMPNDRWRLVWGLSYRDDTLESQQFLGQPEPRHDDFRRLFGNAEWRTTDKLTLNAGAMLEDSGMVGTQLSPRLAANYDVTRSGTLRAVATRAVRSPSLYENYEYNVARFNDGKVLDVLYAANGDLRPETMDSYELGYRVVTPGARLDADFKLFYEHIDDVINNPRDTAYPDALSTALAPFLRPEELGAFVRINAGHIDTSGAEVQVKYQPQPETFVTAAYSYADARGEIIRMLQGTTPTAYNQTVGRNTPLQTASALVAHTFPGRLQTSLAYFYVAGMIWEGDGDAVPRYDRWDARVSKAFGLGGGTGKVSVIVQNLLNHDYLEFREENVFERRVYLQLSARY